MDIYLTLTQALHLVAISLCFLVLLYLLIAGNDKKQEIVPILYFIVLASGSFYFILPPFFENGNLPQWLKFSLLSGDSLLPAISYLLIIQFIIARIPPPLFWTVILIPILATTPFIYANLVNTQICVGPNTCISSIYALKLNKIILSSFVFMLLLVVASRLSQKGHDPVTIKHHKYWLIMSLIVFNLFLLGFELFSVRKVMSVTNYQFALGMLKIAFLYMVFSSIFRVYVESFDLKPITSYYKSPLNGTDINHIKKAKKLLENDKAYHDYKLNREKFAEMIGIKEHQLSRIFNLAFKQSYNDVINSYRINEAKDQLTTTQKSVTEICYDVGFSSITSFNRVFKDATGNAPSKFRDKHKKAS